MNSADLLDRLLTRLRKLRKTFGYTQEAAAEKAGMSYKHYQAVEAGRKRELRLTTLCRLAEAYGLEVHELLAPELPRPLLRRTTTTASRNKPRRHVK